MNDAPAPTDGERMLTTQEAAGLLHMSVGHFRRLCHKEGVVPHMVRRVGKTRTNLYGYLAIDALRSNRANIDEPIAANTALAVTERHEHARFPAVRAMDDALAIRLYEDNQWLLHRALEAEARADAAESALDSLLAARPRRRWWQRRQKGDGG